LEIGNWWFDRDGGGAVCFFGRDVMWWKSGAGERRLCFSVEPGLHVELE
jgi:hypothetical protein